MTVREGFFFACLLALGIQGFQQVRESNHRRLAHLLQYERTLSDDLKGLEARQGNLVRESDALQNDRYYIERLARSELGWRPAADPAKLPLSPGMPPLGDSPAGLAQGAPGSPTGPVAPPAPVDCDRQLIAAIGYLSIDDFQRKMMNGRVTSTLDAPTRERARKLGDELRRRGFASVKEFQANQGVTQDGVLGRDTEQRLLALARPQPAPRRPARPAGIVVHNGNTERRRPGG